MPTTRFADAEEPEASPCRRQDRRHADHASSTVSTRPTRSRPRSRARKPRQPRPHRGVRTLERDRRWARGCRRLRPRRWLPAKVRREGCVSMCAERSSRRTGRRLHAGVVAGAGGSGHDDSRLAVGQGLV
jgi:hypothetical protein